ncbi:hypothetical protein [Leptospira sp. GIMC2001]|uniref:hypothetical protein n=1 Tax=Leptospira sp. GIMC2001 TaxID=1513297 RepID=UPI00234A7C6E|nr:hypothetical protein [Leptospira sp. GIMC2001]WCL50891.1 hypothetical protein O4O04_08790 [Leptospira sp. GIMC2001]
MRKNIIIYAILLSISFINCIANEKPEGNPLDPNKIEGILGIVAAVSGVTRIGNDSDYILLNTFPMNYSLRSVVKVDKRIYGLVNLGSVGNPVYQIFRSFDGINFNEIGNTFGFGSALDRLIYTNNTFYVFLSSSKDRIYTSTDEGVNWTQSNPNYVGSFGETFNCFIGFNGDLYAFFETRMHRSADLGNNFFDEIFTNIFPSRFLSYCGSGSNLFFMVGGYTVSDTAALSDIFVSSSITTNWTRVDNGNFGEDRSRPCVRDFSGNLFAFATINSFDYSLLTTSTFARSLDAGRTWQCKPVVYNDQNVFGIRSGTMVYLNNRLFVYSSDFGNSNPTGAYADLD